jgi:hypothetical protein
MEGMWKGTGEAWLETLSWKDRGELRSTSVSLVGGSAGKKSYYLSNNFQKRYRPNHLAGILFVDAESTLDYRKSSL